MSRSSKQQLADAIRAAASEVPKVDGEADDETSTPTGDAPRKSRTRARGIETVSTVGGGIQRLSFSVDENISSELGIAAIKLKATKNSIVNEALHDWLKKNRRRGDAA
jgi:hypothetical protein